MIPLVVDAIVFFDKSLFAVCFGKKILRIELSAKEIPEITQKFVILRP